MILNLSFISVIVVPLPKEKSCLPSNRMNIGEFKLLPNHYLFVEHVAKALWPVKRNPHVFVGRYINVNRKSDGTIYPTFNRPDYNEKLTFAKFCMEAAKELRQVAKLADSATGLGEEA